MIKLHKLFVLFSAVAAFTACSSSEEANGTDDSLLANAPQTEVYMGVDVLNNYQKVNAVTRAANPLSPTANVNYFNVKVDPRLGFNVAPNKYVGVMNNGKVYTDCPYITINKDKNFDYLLSTNGSGLRTLIAAGDTTTATIVKKLTSWCGRTNPVSPTVVEKNIRVIWYLAKSMENGWHVDGLLTDKDDIKAACDACKDEGFQEITFGENDGKMQLTYQQLADYYPAIYNIKPIDPTLLVDIHQQKHYSWGEIKTSLHIKEAKDVKVFLPVGIDYTVEGVESAALVRYFEKYFEVQDYDATIGANVKLTVERQAAGITINVTGVTKELLKALERRYNDGLTIEIHSYYKLSDKNGESDYIVPVWSALKNSTVTYDGDVKYRITSAFNSESVEN